MPKGYNVEGCVIVVSIFFYNRTCMFKTTIIVYLIYWRDTGNKMKQFGKEMFDFCGVKVAYASKYGRQKIDRRTVGLFLTILQTKDTGFSKQIHCNLHLKVKTTLTTIHTATSLRILLTLKNTSYSYIDTTSAFRMLNVL